MAFTVLIDGYNLAAELWGMGVGARELERQRADLLALLADYGRDRPQGLHVVFDGWREGVPGGSRERERGVDVTFSPKGVTADEVIRDLVRDEPGPFLVVSSDAKVRRWARDGGAEVVDAEAFARRLRAAPPEPGTGPGEAGMEEPDDDAGWSGSTVKKGNPRKRSKRERALQRRLGKL
jgi:predicted RNA-binding protein with PIN domain